MIFPIFHYFQASKSRAHMRALTIFCYEWILRTLNKVSTTWMNRIFQKLIIIIEFENLLFSKISRKMKILEKFQKFFQKSKFSKSFKSLISDRRMFFHIFFRRIWVLECLLLSLKLKRNSGTLWILFSTSFECVNHQKKWDIIIFFCHFRPLHFQKDINSFVECVTFRWICHTPDTFAKSDTLISICQF